MITRRGFICGGIGVALAGITADLANAAAGTATTTNGKLVVDLAANTALNKVGGVLTFDGGKLGPIGIVRSAASTSGFNVVSLVCPHQGELVEQVGSQWVCKRGHNAAFSFNGALKRGPANTGLTKLKFTATKKAITIG
jgi:Rieske Fe-S protein